MTENPDTHTLNKPQSIILITGSKARQYAIKALLRTISTDTSFFIAINTAEVRELLTTWNNSRFLVVIDGWSLDDQSIMGTCLLKENFPGTRCLLLVENSADQAIPRDQKPDKVLVGNISGNKFIELIREMIECGC
jgi:hypothetical protein